MSEIERRERREIERAQRRADRTERRALHGAGRLASIGGAAIAGLVGGAVVQPGDPRFVPGHAERGRVVFAAIGTGLKLCETYLGDKNAADDGDGDLGIASSFAGGLGDGLIAIAISDFQRGRKRF